MEWHLNGPDGPVTITAATPDEAVEKYGQIYGLESYELTDVSVERVEALA